MVGRSGFLLGARKAYYQVRFAVCFREGNLYGRFLSHRIHVGNHYLCLVDFYGKRRDSYHTWILWVSKADGRFKSAWSDSSRSSSSHWPSVPRNYHSRKSHSFPYVFSVCKGKIWKNCSYEKGNSWVIDMPKPKSNDSKRFRSRCRDHMSQGVNSLYCGWSSKPW